MSDIMEIKDERERQKKKTKKKTKTERSKRMAQAIVKVWELDSFVARLSVLS